MSIVNSLEFREIQWHFLRTSDKFRVVGGEFSEIVKFTDIIGEFSNDYRDFIEKFHSRQSLRKQSICAL